MLHEIHMSTGTIIKRKGISFLSSMARPSSSVQCHFTLPEMIKTGAHKRDNIIMTPTPFCSLHFGSSTVKRFLPKGPGFKLTALHTAY